MHRNAELRIGVFGGAFDPPHAGHLALAKTALEQMHLDLLHIIPTGQAWHKTRALTAAEHRLAMTGLAFADLERVVVDAREIERAGPTFTIDTLLELQQQYPGAKLFLIIGQDQADALTTWHRADDILKIAIICVAGRAFPAGATGRFDASNSLPAPFQRLVMPPMDVNATDLRRRLAHHQSVVPLVFEPVARYIALHHLYQSA